MDMTVIAAAARCVKSVNNSLDIIVNCHVTALRGSRTRARRTGTPSDEPPSQKYPTAFRRTSDTLDCEDLGWIRLDSDQIQSAVAVFPATGQERVNYAVFQQAY